MNEPSPRVGAVSYTHLALSVVLSVTVLALYLLFYHQIFAVTFDESFSRATGLKVDACNTLLAILTALTIVLGMRMMGAMPVSYTHLLPLRQREIRKGFHKQIPALVQEPRLQLQ